MIILNGRSFENQTATLITQNINYYVSCTQNITNIKYTIPAPAQPIQ